MHKRNDVASYLDNMSLLLLGLCLLFFPLVFTTTTTDPFTLPKEILFGAAALVALLLLGARMISEGKVTIRKTPFDLPVMLFALVALVSSLLSQNRIDALASFVSLLFAVIGFFVITNATIKKTPLLFLQSCLAAGGVLTSLLAITSFFKVYPLPFAIAKSQTFSPFGSLIDQVVYLAVLLPMTISLLLPLFRAKNPKDIGGKEIAFAACSIIITLGLFTTLYDLLKLQRPILLPFETGFQTAFAAISQDAGRTLQGFLFGSGTGTYVTDFSRFKQPSFNVNQSLWSLTFLHSSSYLLEILATVGFLGIASLVFLFYRSVQEGRRLLVIKNREESAHSYGVFFSFVLLGLASVFLPFGFVTQTLLFVILSLFAVSASFLDNDRFYDVELTLVALKKALSQTPMLGHPFLDGTYKNTQTDKTFSKLMPVSFFVLSLLCVLLIGFFSVRYIIADTAFQSSLVAASANNGIKTYTDESNAISMFPWRDSFYRIYSQTNLAIANSLAAAQPAGSSPSAQVQQTIVTLIQQSINSARAATTISPLSSYNWQNLSSVYRSLIGFGQNAEQFSILTAQQAIVLDPNNPQLYISLGGIYYQLGRWDDAIRQFQIATNLKPDLANAYYNLGHSLEQKGDLQGALTQYQTVKTLIAQDPQNSKKIDGEIAALQAKIGSAAKQNSQEQGKAGAAQNQPLGLNEPQTKLPEQKNQVKIPGLTVSPTVEPTTSPSPSAAPSPTTKP